MMLLSTLVFTAFKESEWKSMDAQQADHLVKVGGLKPSNVQNIQFSIYEVPPKEAL